MNRRKVLGAWLIPLSLALGSTPSSWNAAWAESQDRPAQVGVGFSYEQLTAGYAPWREFYIEGKKVYGDRKVVHATLRRTQRFNLDDNEVVIGGYYPLNQRWTAAVEASTSPSHRVLPQWSATGQVHRALGNGWGIELGAGHRQYTATSVNLERLTLERYWSKYRAAYTLWLSQVQGAGAASSHSLQASYYYQDQSTMTLAFATGREVESLGGGQILVLQTRSLNLWGTHWYKPDWAFTYGLGWTNQRPLYTRSGLQVGLLHQF